MAESDSTRKQRHKLSSAVAEYREALYEDPSREVDIVHEVADKWGVTMKDIRARAETGA